MVGCCRRGHEVDESLSAHVLLENLASKAGGLLSLFHLLKKAGLRPDEVDFVIECSEEAAGDMNQRGGGNFAKAIAEIAGCVNASGLDVRAFCAAPVNALITGASLVASGARKNVVVLAGGALPKLFMNARDHVKKGAPGPGKLPGQLRGAPHSRRRNDPGHPPRRPGETLGRGRRFAPGRDHRPGVGTPAEGGSAVSPMWTSMRPSFTFPKSLYRPGPATFPRPTQR